MSLLCVNVRRARLAPSARLNSAATVVNLLSSSNTSAVAADRSDSDAEPDPNQFNCYVILKLQNVRSSTDTCAGLQPAWEQDFLFETNSLDTGLLIELWNKGMLWDKLLGCLWIPLSEIRYSDPSDSPELNQGSWYVLNGEVVHDPRTQTVIGTQLSTQHMLLIDCHFEPAYEYTSLDQLDRFASTSAGLVPGTRNAAVSATAGRRRPQSSEQVYDWAEATARPATIAPGDTIAVDSLYNLIDSTANDYDAIRALRVVPTETTSGYMAISPTTNRPLYPNTYNEVMYGVATSPYSWRSYGNVVPDMATGTGSLHRSPLRNQMQTPGVQRALNDYPLTTGLTSSNMIDTSPYHRSHHHSPLHLSSSQSHLISRNAIADVCPTTRGLSHVDGISRTALLNNTDRASASDRGAYDTPALGYAKPRSELPDSIMVEPSSADQFVPKDRPYVHSYEAQRLTASICPPSSSVTSAVQPNTTSATGKIGSIGAPSLPIHHHHPLHYQSPHRSSVSSSSTAQPSLSVHQVPSKTAATTTTKLSSSSSPAHQRHHLHQQHPPAATTASTLPVSTLQSNQSSKVSGRRLPQLDLTGITNRDESDSSPILSQSHKSIRTHRKLPQINHR